MDASKAGPTRWAMQQGENNSDGSLTNEIEYSGGMTANIIGLQCNPARL
jgi:hypothetical protein